MQETPLVPRRESLHEPPAEFSRIVEVEKLGERGLHLDLEAGPEERRALARRYDLIDVARLTAKADLTPAGRTDVRLHATWTADVVQSCVVTLEPVPAHLEESFEMTFSPQVAGGEVDEPARKEILVGYDEDGRELSEPPEPLIGGRIDVGEAIAEQLALALDPYPRKPDAQIPEGLVEPSGDAAGAGRRENPFAVLQRLKDKSGGSGEKR